MRTTDRPMPAPDRQNPLLLGFLALSLAIHLLLLYLLPQRLFPTAKPRPEPMVVEVRPPEPLPPPRERELEFAPKKEQPKVEPKRPAKRLAEREHRVARETAPKGEMPEDRLAAPPRTARPRVAPPLPEGRDRRPAREERVRRGGESPPTPTAPSPSPPARVPDLNQLLRLPETTVARLENEWRRKYRPDVERGNAVWLDTEKDILISFFQRFKNNIYGVWNYPVVARDRGEQGTCLLRITVNRDGTLADVRLMESSGFSSLDDEAMAAVRKGAPYGRLPRAYEEETLNIFAFFSYHLTRPRGIVH